MKKRDQGNLFLTLDALVSLDHPYRKLDELLPFDKLSLVYQGLYSSKGRKEKGFEFGHSSDRQSGLINKVAATSA